MEAEETATPADRDLAAKQAFSQDNHKKVSSDELTNRYNTISVQLLREKSVIGDTGDEDSTDPRYHDSNKYSGTHFDNCYWNEGVQWVNDNMALAVTSAIEFHKNSQSEFYRGSVFKYLGFALHATQDFYAHSNWVETHDFGVVSDFSQRPANWVSGTYNNSGDNSDPNPGYRHCPWGTPGHDDFWVWPGMNKDTSGRPGFDEAKADAEIATGNLVDAFVANLRANGEYTETVLKELGFKHFDVTFILNNESTPSGYYKNPADLNKGAHGDYIYLCTKGDPQSAPLTVISGSSPSISCPSDHPVKLEGDLNSGAGGDYIYFCATNAYKDNARVVIGPTPGLGCGTGLTRIDLDLNRKAGGDYVYLCINPASAGGLTISGHVTTAQGAPVAGITVTLAGSREGTMVTDGSGNYAFGGLPPGSYSVRPTGPCAFTPDVVNLNNLNSSVTQDIVASGCSGW